MKTIAAIAAVVALAAPAVHAQGMKGMDMKDMPMKGAKSDKVHKATGTVTKIDQSKARVTVNHGPVASMNWPSMTMAFGVKDKAMLEQIKPGDKIEFSFVQSGRDHTITEIK